MTFINASFNDLNDAGLIPMAREYVRLVGDSRKFKIAESRHPKQFEIFWLDLRVDHFYC